MERREGEGEGERGREREREVFSHQDRPSLTQEVLM